MRMSEQLTIFPFFMFRFEVILEMTSCRSVFFFPRDPRMCATINKHRAAAMYMGTSITLSNGFWKKRRFSIPQGLQSIQKTYHHLRLAA